MPARRPQRAGAAGRTHVRCWQSRRRLRLHAWAERQPGVALLDFLPQHRGRKAPVAGHRGERCAIVIGSDHAGFPLKEGLTAYIRQLGHQVIDVGTRGTEPVD